MLVSEPVGRALAELGYVTPTPIQTQVVPAMLQRLDVVGQAQTGTGKTAAFGIPIAEMVDGREAYTQAIVLVPTRELAVQVTEELKRIFRYRGIRVAAIYGGQAIKVQFEALDAGAHVVVGTPGRVIDHLDRRTLSLQAVKTVVLDEADQMLDIGFAPDIRRILRQTPRDRQTTLFTATIPTQIKRLIYAFLEEPTWFKVGGESEPVAEVRQTYCEVAGRDKLRGLMEVLQEVGDEQTMVFCRTQIAVDRIVEQLRRRGHEIEGIHGRMPQPKRTAVMRGFREGRIRALVATNLASRGLDIPAVANVINFDMPDNVEEYVHRIGRTARMGRPGTAMIFVSEWDLPGFDAIREHVGEESLERFELSFY